MITIDPEILEKINNPLQLPSNQGDPQLMVGFAGGPYPIAYDIGKHIKNGTISSSYDDYIYNVNLTVNKAAVFGNLENPMYPIYPGSVGTIAVKFGSNNEDWIHIAYFFIDEVSWDDGDTFTISGTNNIGHRLSKCNMGETIKLTGLPHEVVADIMEIAGVTRYSVQAGTYEWTYTYKSSDTCLSALEQMYPIFPKDGLDQPGFGILEKPDGTVVFGYWRDRNEELPVQVYELSSVHDCFKFSTRKTSDKCYRQVYATGKAAEGFDLNPVTINVDNFSNWVIPTNKIYFADFNGYTHQELLEDWAQTVALELQYQGITDEVSGPFRPQLTVGDIATFTDLSNRQGVITSITHHIGEDGFSTDFTVDSGGVYNAVSGWSSSMKANGYNRRQKLADLVHDIAEETSKTAISYNDPISVREQEYDEVTEDPIEIIPERNKTTFIYDGRNWQDLPGVPVIPESEE